MRPCGPGGYGLHDLRGYQVLRNLLVHRYGVRMAGEIQSRCRLARDVDLRVLNRRPVRFLNQVLRYGILVFMQDEKKRVEFETGVLKEYLDFKPFLREYDIECRRRLIYGD